MRAFERARELAESLAEPQLLASAIFGLWANRYVAGTPFGDLAERFAQVADGERDQGLRCVGLRMLSVSKVCSYRGDDTARNDGRNVRKKPIVVGYSYRESKKVFCSVQ
jgi:hypothetical protein